MKKTKKNVDKYTSEFLIVKNENDCVEIATMDAYDNVEIGVGWLTCIGEVFEGIEVVQVLNQEVRLMGFDIDRENTVVAICKSGKKTARVLLSSIEWRKLSKAQQLWLNAYLKNDTH